MTSGIQFKGEIPHTDCPLPTTDAVSGDYYVLTSSGEDSDGVKWNEGDWAIYDSTASKFRQINNTGKVLSFNDRAGAITACPDANSTVCDPNKWDYDWSMIDKTDAKLQEITDIPVPDTNHDTDKILKKEKIMPGF